MRQITIRDVRAEDVPEIKAIIAGVWDWEGMFDGERTLDAALGIYLNQVLFEATFGRAAVVNGKVAGVIFGSVDGVEPKYRTLLEDGTAHALTLLAAPESDRKTILGYFAKIAAIYEELTSGIMDDYDGTLDFLVLAKEAQGLGIGKRLWAALKAYFAENNTKRIYLYSDTECNTGFYESQGFAKRLERKAAFDFDGEVFEADIFLYDIRLD
ncbi:MAG: GNAT family N-acetyltransferase [Treponema sp.]|nr:GNAT family N-acetyltransferase [Treponema sp.]